MLNAEVTPQLDVASWSFSVEGLVSHPTTWTWEEIHALPESSYSGDIHCVTTWSKLGVHFGGVSVDTLLGIAGLEPAATHVMAFTHTGYTTNLPLPDVTGGRAWVVWEYENAPLPIEHGGPARLLVPHLYFWKSANGWPGYGCSTTTNRGSGSAMGTTSGRSVARAAIPGRLGSDH